MTNPFGSKHALTLRTARPYLAGLLILGGASAFSAETQFEKACAELGGRRGADTERLHELFKLDWDHTMRESPEFATMVGYPGQNDRWSDRSLEAIERGKRELQASMRVIESIDRSKLAATDQLNYDLFKKNQQDAIEGARFKAELMPINQMGGVQQEVARVLDFAPRSRARDYEDLLARLDSVPALVEQTIVLLQKGLEAGITPPRITLRDVPQQIKNQMIEEPEHNAMLRPFREFPGEIPKVEQEQLRERAETALRRKVIPEFGKLYEFFEKSYLPKARQSIAMSDLPDGKAWYAHNVRTSTTTSMSPKEIHELGLAEVKRIRQEMDALIKQIGFKGDFPAFCKYLRSD